MIPRHINEYVMIACYGVEIDSINATKVPIESLLETTNNCVVRTFI